VPGMADGESGVTGEQVRLYSALQRVAVVAIKVVIVLG